MVSAAGRQSEAEFCPECGRPLLASSTGDVLEHVYDPGDLTRCSFIERVHARGEARRNPDDRDRQADERERLADLRERRADDRETRADERETRADKRETALDRRERQLRDEERTVRLRLPARASGADSIDRARDAVGRSSERLRRSDAALDRTAARTKREQAEIDREVEISRESSGDASS